MYDNIILHDTIFHHVTVSTISYHLIHYNIM